MVDWTPAIDDDHHQQQQHQQKTTLRRGQRGQRRRNTPTATARGQYKSAAGLTFLTLNEAGHLAPMDQPAVTLAMVRCVLVSCVSCVCVWLLRMGVGFG
jgi:carboxypeptidase C (cathepsin A)